MLELVVGRCVVLCFIEVEVGWMLSVLVRVRDWEVWLLGDREVDVG